MRKFIASWLAPHQWTENEDERSCHLCGRIEHIVCYPDGPFGDDWIWQVHTKGNRMGHLASIKTVPKDRSQPAASIPNVVA